MPENQDAAGVSRRAMFATPTAALPLLAPRAAPARSTRFQETAPMNPPNRMVVLRLNGQEHRLAFDPRVTLLDALRDHLGLTGSKKGCDQGSAALAPCCWTAAGYSPA